MSGELDRAVFYCRKIHEELLRGGGKTYRVELDHELTVDGHRGRVFEHVETLVLLAGDSCQFEPGRFYDLTFTKSDYVPEKGRI